MGNGIGENRLRTIRRRAVAVDRDRAAHPAPLVGNARAYRKAPTEHGLTLYSHEASVAREIRRHGHIALLGAVSARITFHLRHDRTSAIVRLIRDKALSATAAARAASMISAGSAGARTVAKRPLASDSA